jgi:Spy/CpxP family protein refolding chaperone
MRIALRVMYLGLAAAIAILGQSPGSQLRVKLARLLPIVRSSNNNAGLISPPTGSSFLWIQLELPQTETTPIVLDVYGTAVEDASGRTFPVFGILPSSAETAIVGTAFRPVGSNASQAWLTAYSTSSGPDVDFALNAPVGSSNGSAKLTIKKVPAQFSLFFVVPSTGGSYKIIGLGGKELTTGDVGGQQASIAGRPPTTDGLPDPTAVAEKRVFALDRVLTLTAHQTAKVTTILTAAHKARMESATTAENAAKTALVDAIKTNSASTIDEATMVLGDLARRMLIIDATADAEVFALLNPEQQRRYRNMNSFYSLRPMNSAAIARTANILGIYDAGLTATDEMLARALARQVGLTEDQLREVTALFIKASAALSLAQLENRAELKRISEAIEKKDAAEIERSAAALGKISARFASMRAKAEAERFALLTTEQRRKYAGPYPPSETSPVLLGERPVTTTPTVGGGRR